MINLAYMYNGKVCGHWWVFIELFLSLADFALRPKWLEEEGVGVNVVGAISMLTQRMKIGFSLDKG